MFILQPISFLPPKGSRARALALAFLFLAPIAVALLAISMGQDANWDLRNYHYYNAYAFLNGRYDRDLLPSQTPYFYNPLMDVPFFLLASHFSAKTTGFVLGLIQGLNAVLLFLIAHAVLIIPNARMKVLLCAALSTLGILGGGGIAQIGTTFGDNITSLGVLLSAALVVRFMDRLTLDAAPRALGLALLFGIPAGMMMGLKLPAVGYAIGLCGALLFAGGDFKRNFVLAFAFGIGVLLGCAVTLAHWATFLNSHFGSPLFPYFNEIFRSPLAPLVSARDTQFAPHSLSDYFVMPFLFAKSAFRVGEIDWRDWRLTILYVLLPLATLIRFAFGRARAVVDSTATPNSARYMMVFISLSYAVWLAMFSIYRYAVTMEMVAPLVIVLAVGMLPLKLGTRGLVTAFILAVISASILPGDWHRRPVWLDKFVEAEIPPLGDTSNLMILMAGFEPYSHLVPEFPAEISFVRVQSNFTSPDQDKGINALAHKRVEAHRAKGGRFMVLIPAWQVNVAAEALSYFGLKIVAPECKNVTDKLFDDKAMSLCPVL